MTDSITTVETISINRKKFLEAQRAYTFLLDEVIRKGLEVVIVRGVPEEVRILQNEGNEYSTRFVTLKREEARRVVEVLQKWLGGEK